MVIKKLWQFARHDTADQDANVKVMRNAAAIDVSDSTSMSNLKLHASVPTLNVR